MRNPTIVAVGRHYALTVATRLPADPQSKGGSEATVRIAKADLVPTEHNLRGDYGSFTELEAACAAFSERVNTREHRITRRAGVMLAEERERLHRLPEVAHTVCFGETGKVSWQSTISVGGALYSVPSTLVDERVWARTDGAELVVVHADGQGGPREVAGHALTTPGRPSIDQAHYPPRPAGAIERKPRASTADEDAFLAIGPGTQAWLIATAAAGAARVRRKLAEAVDLAKLHDAGQVDEALRAAADAVASPTAISPRSSATTAARSSRSRRARARSSRCSTPRAPGRALADDRQDPTRTAAPRRGRRASATVADALRSQRRPRAR